MFSLAIKFIEPKERTQVQFIKSGISLNGLLLSTTLSSVKKRKFPQNIRQSAKLYIFIRCDAKPSAVG